MERPKPQRYTAIIESKVQLTGKIYLVNFKLQTPDQITFIAGQTISLNVGPGINRSMSIASPPQDSTHILMCHDVYPGGPGSQWTIHHNVGDIGTFMAPLGIFNLQKETHRKKVMVATGTGIAPFRSILLDYLENGGTNDVTVYWGLRHDEDVYWVSDFQELSAKHPNFRFILTLSQPSDAWKGTRGRVTEHVVQEEQNPVGSEFYLCGNQLMIKDIEAQLNERAVPGHQIYKELYF